MVHHLIFWALFGRRSPDSGVRKGFATRGVVISVVLRLIVIYILCGKCVVDNDIDRGPWKANCPGVFPE